MDLELLYDHILLMLTLNRQKMKERILIGEKLQIQFRLHGEVLCDVTHPLRTSPSIFEHNPDGKWIHFGLMSMRETLQFNPDSLYKSAR